MQDLSAKNGRTVWGASRARFTGSMFFSLAALLQLVLVLVLVLGLAGLVLVLVLVALAWEPEKLSPPPTSGFPFRR